MSAEHQREWRLVVDASVVVEYLLSLTYVEQATRVFRRLVDEPDGVLWAPDLVYPECASALRKLVVRKRLSRAKARERVYQLTRLPLTIGRSAALAVDAFDFSEDLTVYDATYAALAHRVAAPLVTADTKLARALTARRRQVVILSDY